MASNIVVPSQGEYVTHEDVRAIAQAAKTEIEALQGGSGILAEEIVIADAGAFTAQTEIEGALQEIYQHLLTAQGHISVPLSQLRITTAFDVGNIAAIGGVLASDSDPVLSAINDATDGCQRVLWASGSVVQVMFQVAVPPDLDDAADMLLYTRIASGGTTDAVGFAVASYFNEGDTAVADTSATNQTTTYANALTTIAAADIPAGARTMTIGLTPVTHGNDSMALTNVEIYYQRKLLTS